MFFTNFNIEYFMLGIIIMYIPFHLLEEAFGNFPLWMKEHKWMPEKISYGHWMANNIFFYFPLLVTGISLYHFVGQRMLFTGVGIIIWGLINCLDHIVYTIIDHRKSPGIFTGLGFGVIAIGGLLKLYLDSKLTVTLIVLSIIMGLLYAFFPVILSILCRKKFKNIFI